MRNTLQRRLLHAATVALVGSMAGACDAPPSACEPLCDEALGTVESCLEEWALTWGDELGYADPDDYLGWCGTFLGEQVRLATARLGPLEGQTRVRETCAEQIEQLGSRDCDAYHDSWDLWDEYTQP